MAYLTWKALHIIGMVCWFAELFYLPRLYVYHAMAQTDGDTTTMRRFCVMERKLYVMGHIGMGLTLVFGGLLLWAGGWAFLKGQGWLHAKLLLVAGLVAFLFDTYLLKEPGNAFWWWLAAGAVAVCSLPDRQAASSSTANPR